MTHNHDHPVIHPESCHLRNGTVCQGRIKDHGVGAGTWKRIRAKIKPSKKRDLLKDKSDQEGKVIMCPQSNSYWLAPPMCVFFWCTTKVSHAAMHTLPMHTKPAVSPPFQERVMGKQTA